MNINPGATINNDFMCSHINSRGRIGNSVVTVHHCLKDYLPAEFWMVVCVPFLRFVYVDARILVGSDEWHGQVLRDRLKRERFLADLSVRFISADEIWAWAEKLDLPRKDCKAKVAT